MVRIRRLTVQALPPVAAQDKIAHYECLGSMNSWYDSNRSNGFPLRSAIAHSCRSTFGQM